MKPLLRDDLIQRLRDFDEEASLLFDCETPPQVIIVGGGALVLMEVIPRGTHDIDALDAPKQLLELMQAYDINMRVQTYINNFPYNYMTRVQPLDIGAKFIKFYTASLEDIVVAKLYSPRDTDWADITSPFVLQKINWNVLRTLATDEMEAKASALNEKCYNEFFLSFCEYERKFRPCDN